MSLTKVTLSSEASGRQGTLRRENLFVRDADLMSLRLGAHALRIAVKDERTNQRMLGILSRALTDEKRPKLNSPQHPQQFS